MSVRRGPNKARLGDVIYWFGCIAAATILAIGVADWLGQGRFFVFVSWAALEQIPFEFTHSLRA